MPGPLDYSQHRPRFTRGQLRWLLRVGVVFAIVLLVIQARAWYRDYQAARFRNAYRVIDADVPGTHVFFRDRDLGSVPVLLSKKECADLGLPTAPTAGIDHDGWGEGIVFFDRAQNVDTRLMLKVPDRAASRYLTIETPWGPRTKNAGGWDLPNGFRSRFMTRGQDGLGMTTTLDFDPSPRPGADKVIVTITVANTGSSPFAGFRPEVELLWGTFDERWVRRFHRTFALPPEFAKIAPGQTLRQTVEIPKPASAGDYSVFATFNLFADEKSDYLAGRGSVYSDSKLLHVR